MRFFKTPRAIRTPFRNTEIMTARGFGKRNDENMQSNYGRENEIESENNEKKSNKFSSNQCFLPFLVEQDMINDYGMSDEKIQRSFLYPYFQNLLKLPRFSENVGVAIPIKNHRLQLRNGPLKFQLNDGNLRTARGFGKRSYFIDTIPDDGNRSVRSFL